MKQIAVCLFMLCIGNKILSQTNTFPTSGAVGIGTLSPTVKLDILAGDASSSGRTQLKHGSSGIYLQQYVGNSESEIITGNNHFYFENYGGVRMSILANGNTGIGTLSPDGKFSVATGTGSQLNIANGGTNMLEVSNYSSASGYRQLYFMGAPLAFYTATAGSGSGSEKMRITESGNVGVGTTNPTYRFSVNTGISSSSAGAIEIQHSTDGVNKAGALLGIAVDNSGESTNAAELWFATANGGALSEKMRITNTGNVGIGVTAPAEKLTVDGNILAKRIKITQLGWSDYVFHSTYKLRSLSSLELFIKQNKHLPEIPSAKEVEEKGISVGDNQALLLKKIEELTLYILDLDKKNKTLTKRVATLEKRKK